MTAEAEPRTLRPLIVVRIRRAMVTSLDEINRSQQFVRQFTAVRQFSDHLDCPLSSPVIVTRSNAKYLPDQDAHLVAARTNAHVNDQLLVMDDVFRLIDSRSAKQAERGMAGLLLLKPPIYSVSHGRLLLDMPKSLIQSEFADQVRESTLRSKAIRDGLTRLGVERPKPTAEAVQSAIATKKKRADKRAARLIDDINRVIAALPEDRRQNRNAIATALNEANVPPPSGRGRWQGITVKRVLDRAGSLQPT